MKAKILSFFVMITLITVLPSCEGPMGPMGPEGPPGVETWGVYDMEVVHEDWKWDNENKEFYYEFDFPDLSAFIASDGLVLAAIRTNSAYFNLPHTNYFILNNIRYAQKVDLVYGEGWIRFVVKANDLFLDSDLKKYKPDSYFFKVTLHW